MRFDTFFEENEISIVVWKYNHFCISFVLGHTSPWCEIGHILWRKLYFIFLCQASKFIFMWLHNMFLWKNPVALAHINFHWQGQGHRLDNIEVHVLISSCCKDIVLYLDCCYILIKFYVVQAPTSQWHRGQGHELRNLYCTFWIIKYLCLCYVWMYKVHTWTDVRC